jgi:glycosyltransferase involved in cell wall biosynthesis
MNILLLTDLYPADAKHSPREISHALHDFAKQWSLTENVLVLRPFIVPDWQRKNRQIRSGADQLDGVKILHTPVLKIPWLHCFFLAELYRCLRKSGFQPQVIVAHLGFNLIFACRLAQLLQVPLIAAVHLGDLKHGPAMLGEKLMRRIYHHATGVACRSPMIHQRFSEKFPEFADKCFIAYSGIDPSVLHADDMGREWLEKWKITRPIDFCTLATLKEYKNIAFNLNALSRLSPSIDWKYKIIGDGPEKIVLQRLAISLGIAARVEFRGFLPAPLAMQELRSSHIFLMLSRETFGLAFLEAMACGLVVVGARGYGIDGILENGKNGFLCSPEDQVELASLLEKIINNTSPDELKSILTKARETVSQYTLEKAAANYLKNIYRLIKNQRRY